ncbi:MAG TPA: redoxin domain-containing protein [Rubrobacter sp.]|nr:redoxin domain-containing protein [Rubrobacter sp.]
MFTRTRTEPVPEVGADAPEFNLPSAQGGQLRLSMRTARGPVVVAFYRPGDEEDVEYFKALAAKEQEINMAAGSVVAIGVAEPAQARNFARASGLKSYVLYDYARVASRQWGLLDKDRKRGDSSRPAVFVVGPDRKVAHAWVGERPAPEEILAKISEISGLPKPAEKPEEPKKEEAGGEKPKKMSAEEREKIKAERRAAREAGKSVKSGQAGESTSESEEAPKKLSAEDRERIKAERRAAREAGKSVRTGASATTEAPAETSGSEDKPKKMSAEERERIKAERRAAREAGKSLKQPASQPDPDSEEEASKKEG